ncbi:hypothetical protein [Ascidiimonas aurantiaca]|uniref:hypothetical protein n=1 Tax=Ascidiimonas aurantiaca TaxID=1685432 RepID=UPI0030EC980A
MKWKLQAFWALFCVLLAIQANAQTPSPPPGFSEEQLLERKVEKYVNTLQLDDLQKALLRSSFEKYGKKIKEIQTSEGDRKEKREAFALVMKEQHEELAAYLNEEQLLKFKELQSKERSNRALGKNKRRRNN